jgi:histone H1/5
VPVESASSGRRTAAARAGQPARQVAPAADRPKAGLASGKAPAPKREGGRKPSVAPAPDVRAGRPRAKADGAGAKPSRTARAAVPPVQRTPAQGAPTGGAKSQRAGAPERPVQRSGAAAVAAPRRKARQPVKRVAPPSTPTKRPAARVAKRPVRGTAKKGKRARLPFRAEPPVRELRIRALDPLAKCGPGTSVEELYRVDERVDGRDAVHLVFFDHHGWYCIHGRTCVAVDDVRRDLRARGIPVAR